MTLKVKASLMHTLENATAAAAVYKLAHKALNSTKIFICVNIFMQIAFFR